MLDVLMVLETDFDVRVDYDDSGPIVVVTHRPTGFARRARLGSGESVQAVKNKLLLAVQNQIYNPDEFQFNTGRSEVDGKTRTFHRLIHVPTGKSRTTIGDMTKSRRDEMLDEIVRELWDEGIRPQ